MLRLTLVLICLIASVWVGVEIMRHPGYLLLVFQPWMVQMPIWFALLAFIMFFVLFYFIIDSIDKIQFLWYRILNGIRFRREQKSYSKTQSGVAALLEGNYKQAEKRLLAGVSDTVEPLINYLGAAKAAHEQNAYERRDQYLEKAYLTSPNETIAIGLTQAALALEQNQIEHAIATLNHLRHKNPWHPGVLRMLSSAYRKLDDWQNLLLILPYLRKTKGCSLDDLQQVEREAYCHILNAVPAKTYDELQKIWQGMPSAMRHDPTVMAAYINQLSRFPNTTKTVEELIKKVLKHHWQPQLLDIYAALPFNNLNRQLVIVGAWLKIYGPQPALLLLLGQLCERLKLWGKAKDYFEKCLSYGPNTKAALAYGALLEELNEREEALQLYRLALHSVDSKRI